MPNFDALDEDDVRDVNVELVTLGGREKITVSEGTTAREFKEQHDIVGKKLIDQNSNVLRDSDTIKDGMQLFVSAPKQNG